MFISKSFIVLQLIQLNSKNPEIKKEIKICIETNENENTTTQNLWVRWPLKPGRRKLSFLLLREGGREVCGQEQKPNHMVHEPSPLPPNVEVPSLQAGCEPDPPNLSQGQAMGQPPSRHCQGLKPATRECGCSSDNW